MPRLCSSLLLSLLIASSASALTVTTPSGLAPGDQYRLVFVTSSSRFADSPNIADYNSFVTAVANSVTELSALSATWTAIGSTATQSARDNTGTNPAVNGTGVPIYLLNDTLLAASNADLWDGAINAPLAIDESGVTRSAVVWTGTNSDGSQAALSRALGGNGTSGGNALIGYTTCANADWIHAGSCGLFEYDNVFHFHSLYAMSSIVTVPVPEPGTGLLVIAGLVGLVGWRRVRA